jgi:hypothetical protein
VACTSAVLARNKGQAITEQHSTRKETSKIVSKVHLQ